MIIKRTIVKQSLISGAGLGCFLNEDVKENDVIWKFNPRFDLLFSEDEVSVLEPAIQEFVRHYGYYDKQQFRGWWVLHSGNDRFCNHSKHPTLVAVHKGGCQYDMVASRDLYVDDELTCDYTEYEDRNYE